MLGRALTFRPKVICLDEPLSALDDQTKEEMYHLFRMIRKETGVTALHISHSFEEVSKLADRVLFIKDGQIIQFLPEDYSNLGDLIRADGTPH